MTSCANCEMPIGDEGSYYSDWYRGDVCHKCYFLNQTKKKPKIYALIGQRGSGKTTLAHKVAKILPALHIAKRHTTRHARDESDLEDHIFVDEKSFDKLEFIHSDKDIKGYRVGFHANEVTRPKEWYKKDVIIPFTDTGSFLAMKEKIEMIPVFMLVDEKDLKIRLKSRSKENSLTEPEFVEETERFLDTIHKTIHNPEMWVIQNKTGHLKQAIKQLMWIIRRYRAQ